MDAATRYRTLKGMYQDSRTWGRLQPRIVGRDGGRCRALGCGATEDVAVHHCRYWRSRWLWMRACGLLAGAGWLGWSGDLVGAGKAGLLGVALGWWVSHDSPAWLVTLCQKCHRAVHTGPDGWLPRRLDPLGIRLRWRTWKLIGWRQTLRLRGTHWFAAAALVFLTARRLA